MSPGMTHSKEKWGESHVQGVKSLTTHLEVALSPQSDELPTKTQSGMLTEFWNARKFDSNTPHVVSTTPECISNLTKERLRA